MRVRLFKFFYYNRKKSLFFAEERGRNYNFFERLHIYLNPRRRLELPFIDLDVNTACNLNCAKCAKYIPYYKKQEMYSADAVIDGLRTLLKYIDRIYALSIIGGEPFLNPDIAEVIVFCSSCEQILDVDITTNATVLPSDATFQTLADSRVVVYVSNYPNIGKEREITRSLFLEKLKSYHIPFRLIEHDHWLDFGAMRAHQFSASVKKAMFFHCPMNSCSVYRNHTLYRCGRACYLTEHGILREDCGVIHTDQIKSRRQMRKKLYSFFSLPYLAACDYCSCRPEHVPPGPQTGKDNLPKRTID